LPAGRAGISIARKALMPMWAGIALFLFILMITPQLAAAGMVRKSDLRAIAYSA